MVEEVKAIQSHIESDFCGLVLGNRYELANGQVWEQTEPLMWAWVWVRPKVEIVEQDGTFMMKVEKIDRSVSVRRVK